jgi:hypothetical protein
MAEKPLRLVTLLEPELCLDCRFAVLAEGESEDGHFRRTLYCLRLDCDNWGREDPAAASAEKEVE